jgi:aryl-alcohol dehydrogenase-like predicted oxidoreductase
MVAAVTAAISTNAADQTRRPRDMDARFTSHVSAGHQTSLSCGKADPMRARGGRKVARMAALPVAPFGRTGHDSTRLIFGAAALGSMSQERADATMALVDEAGINHIDTAAGYGASEERLKPFLDQHGYRFFVATKTGERESDAARAELERSLDRLGLDHVDLIQLHNLVEPDEWEVAFAPGGAVEALVRAREEGLTNAIGVTGHGVRIAAMHLRALERFDFDSVLFPFNHSMMSNSAYRDDVERLREVCRNRDVAMQTIKAIAKGRWSNEDLPRHSWYEPLTDPAAIDRAVRYVLSNQDLFLNTSSDARLLPLVIAAAQGDLSAPTSEELIDDEAAFDITPLFDGADLERI